MHAFAQARSINNKGQITGVVVDDNGLAHHTTGFLLSQGKYVTIPSPQVNGGSIDDLRINNRGQIVGSYVVGKSRPHGFLLSRGKYTDIRFPNAQSTRPFGSNTKGNIVGIYTHNQTSHGFLRRHGIFTTIDFPDAEVVNVFGINDKGQIVGQYGDYSGSSHGFLLDHGTRTIIDITKDTVPFGINNRGQIVGVCCPTGHQNDCSGFLWDHGKVTQIVFPNESGSLTALGINDKGQIVGGYVDRKHQWHGFLRNP